MRTTKRRKIIKLRNTLDSFLICVFFYFASGFCNIYFIILLPHLENSYDTNW